MKCFIGVVVLTAALSACAPSQTAVSNPTGGNAILKPGQTWVVEASDANRKQETFSFTLSSRPNKEELGIVAFENAGGPYRVQEGVRGESLYYDPLDSDPEFLVANSYLVSKGQPTVTRFCVVLNPSQNQDLTRFRGVFTYKVDDVGKYVVSGNASGFGQCTITLSR
jgi:hypothetical protein